jgi:hypothetical protein
VVSISATTLLAGCAGHAVTTAVSAGTAGQGRAAPTPPPVRSPAAPPPLSVQIHVGVSDNHHTVELEAGATLVLTLPRLAERELGAPLIRSSDTAVLRPVAGPLQTGRPGAVLVVYFRAVGPGTALIRATGMLPFTLLVQVLPA